MTTDVPEDRDLETPLEVAIWTWSWMEPPLGQISFLLLTMQVTDCSALWPTAAPRPTPTAYSCTCCCSSHGPV